MRIPIHACTASLIAAMLFAAGCGSSPPTHFYDLAATAAPMGGAPATSRLTIMVGPVSVPASVDQPQMVVQVAVNQVDVDEFHRWVAPLNDSIARAVAGDLAAQLGTPRVATAPMANFDPAYRVTINVQRFESIKDQSVLVDAVWTVRKTAGGAVRSGRTIAREPVAGPGFDALAAAHSRAIATLSADIAAAIRAEAAAQD